MSNPADAQDDYIKDRSIKVSRGGVRLPSDQYRNPEMFDAYCRANSGPVKTYNLKDLEKGVNTDEG
jgi:hypothetical protein